VQPRLLEADAAKGLEHREVASGRERSARAGENDGPHLAAQHQRFHARGQRLAQRWRHRVLSAWFVEGQGRDGVGEVEVNGHACLVPSR
jgi:hypothetical protein